MATMSWSLARAFGCFASLSLLEATPAWAACGDDVLDSEGEECDDGNSNAADGCSPECLIEECLEVDGAATGHTCQHGSFGPFATVQGFAYPGSVFGNVSTPHTYFTMTLNGELGNNRSAIEFMPVVNDSYAIYLKKPYPMEFRTPDGEPVPIRFEHAVTTCEVADSLTWVRVYGPLTASTSYIVDVGPWEEAEVSFAFESLGSFSSEYFLDRDGDGFNGDAPAAFSPCVPDEPFEASAGDDCDDDAADIHPGAPETCDGIDADCDGEELPAGQSCDMDGTGGSAGSAGASGVTSSGGSSPEATVSTGTGAADAEAAGSTGAAGAEVGTDGAAGAAGAGGASEEAAAANGGASAGSAGSGGVPSSGGTNPGSGVSEASGGGGSGCGCILGPGTAPPVPGSFAWALGGTALAVFTRRRHRSSPARHRRNDSSLRRTSQAH